MTPLLRRIFGTLSALSPKMAGWAAHRLFTTSLPTGRLTPAEKQLAKAADAKLSTAQDIGFQKGSTFVAAYRFAAKGQPTGKRIVLVHGWMSAARYMLAMASALQQNGYEVICIDLPAHGASGGRVTSLVDCAEALNQLLVNIGGANRIVAHSFGGAVTAYVLSRINPSALGRDGKVILMASPNLLSSVTETFSRALGLNAAAQQHYEATLCKTIGASLTEMDGNLMYAKSGYPMHILHCVDDAEVPIGQSRRFMELGTQARLTELSGLGHRRILYHPTALSALIEAVH
jgi:pimeloyl-ACP methyl ester carboxylesterase